MSLLLSFSDSPFFFFLVAFFAKDFEVSARRTKLVFSAFPLLFFPKKQGLEGQEWGLSNGGSRPLSAICAHVYNCVLMLPFWALSKRNFRHKMTTIVGYRGQLWTSTLKWGLKATLCNLRTVVYNCALSWPFGPLPKGVVFRHKMIVDKHLRPPFAKPPFRLCQAQKDFFCHFIRRTIRNR